MTRAFFSGEGSGRRQSMEAETARVPCGRLPVWRMTRWEPRLRSHGWAAATHCSGGAAWRGVAARTRNRGSRRMGRERDGRGGRVNGIGDC